MTTEEALRKILLDQFEPEYGPPKMDEDLYTYYGIDSLDALELVLTVEDEFDIKVHDADTIAAVLGYPVAEIRQFPA